MSDNGRIAKNTVMLYVRMIFLAVVNLVTVRVVLGALGDVDYGVSMLIGSVVFSLWFVTSTLSSASQRYFAFHLGRNDIESYRKTFSMLMICMLGLSAIVVAAGEAVAPFLVTDWLNIPPDRQYAAQWAYQTTLLCFVFNLLIVPYTASMVAYEKINGFAYVSIIDGLLKLAVAWLTAESAGDRLIVYSVLTAAEWGLVLVMYYVYCRRRFSGCRMQPGRDLKLFRELMGYTGWNLFGSVSGVLVTQGQNILLNLFFGPVINAAKGIADRLHIMIQSIGVNFFMAVSPQIIKSYASGERERMESLVIGSTKYSYYLLLLLAFPIYLLMEPLLNIWLEAGDVTAEMIIFCKLSLIYCLVTVFEQPITQMIRATGKIKRYQVSVGVVTLCYLPLAWIALKLGFEPQSTMWVLIAVYAFVMIIRLMVARRQMDFQVGKYMRIAILPSTLVTVILLLCGWLLTGWECDAVAVVLLKGLAASAIVAVVVYATGLNGSERKKIVGVVVQKLKGICLSKRK